MVASPESVREQALASGATVEEASQLHDLVRKRTPFPESVTGVRFRFGEDSSGDPALWVTIVAMADLNPTIEKVDRIRRFAEDLRSDILESHLTDRWPYVEIETE